MVNGRLSYFHKWDVEMDVITPSVRVGGHNGGVTRRPVAVVEDILEGTCSRVSVEEVVFVDTMNRDDFNEAREIVEKKMDRYPWKGDKHEQVSMSINR